MKEEGQLGGGYTSPAEAQQREEEAMSNECQDALASQVSQGCLYQASADKIPGAATTSPHATR